MISGSFRFLINTESLNGVETVGNLSRHRTAPVVLKTSVGYLVRYVPAISGESLAHAYQVALVDLAKKEKLPVGVFSSRYDFIKFSTDEVLEKEKIEAPKKAGNEKNESPKIAHDARRFEVDVMLHDVVADVGGFMYAGNPPVRRTSRVKFGYMIPALIGDDIPAQLEAQFHVRSSQSGQMIYNVEVSSALYVMSFSLDEDLIAVPSTEGEKVKGEEELEKQRELRVKVAIQALYSVLTGNFGGKKSRFLPSMKLMSGVVTVTDFPFVPEPGHSNDYVKTTMQRLSKAQGIFNGKGKAYVINNEGVEEGEGAVKVSNVEELVEKLMGK